MSDNDTLAEAMTGRHSGTQLAAQWFAFDDRADWASVTRAGYRDLAVSLLLTTPDVPELTTALQKLLESLDAALRAGV